MEPKTRLYILSYETPYTPCAGIAAVMKHLPRALAKASEKPVTVLSPFHHRVIKIKDFNRLVEFSYPYSPQNLEKKATAHLYEASGVEWFFLKPEGGEYFRGSPHPYALAQKDLVRDSLLFGRMALSFLDKIRPHEKQLVMLKDWQTISTCLSNRSSRQGRRFFLVLHNTYDASADNSDLREAGYDPSGLSGVSLLDQGLSKVAHPVFTVSDGFAADIKGDPLQCKVMAPHLTKALQDRLVGVNNGPFASLSIGGDLLKEMRQNQFQGLEAWKQKYRSEFIKAVNEHQPDLEYPVWGEPKVFFSHTKGLPWLVMAGRADFNQKGYDLAAWAVERFLRKKGEAGFVFLPMPGGQGFEELMFLTKLAYEHPENVLVLPFRMERGYPQIIQACHFGLMPSFYEPFGMANEFYQNGCVGLARATGGLVDQILDPGFDFRICPWLKPKNSVNHTTGILFREDVSFKGIHGLWGDVFAKNGLDKIQYRRQNPLYANMAGAMEQAFFRAVNLCVKRPLDYYNMLLQGIDYISDNLSWIRAAHGYWKNMKEHDRNE
ncbi:glycogen/starch synthase [Dethiosulfatarculus sandiegensis]|uniref:starch synthase n=1 Tax=Dethiosulfatarculus sandiegensis TaxID=1429043 RepID=A0A0D2JSL6_9BACT|nr:glycogen/starch synthase [Dethiosulfatarculus sandiegensis]KIX12475.1 hypothetical protein X474_19275 [Dethiosulfatarculus sandiegensis]